MGDGSGSALGVAHQTAQDNYTYDETGNLVEDRQAGSVIEWTVYGKVKTVARTDGSQKIEYLYDASGNRTVKTVRAKNLTTNAVTTTSTYYVRDAQGNVLAVYDDNNGTGTVRQSEVYLYGSSRLGVFRPAGSRSLATNGIHTRRLGQKEYELTDHLGNVRAVIGDYRQSEGGNIRAALKAYFNHYAFGLEMPGMVWKGGNSYRYGYNGKELDADFANNYDYGFRIYSPAVGRFLSVDPLAASYPWYTPYQFAGNKPINSIDIDGLEEGVAGTVKTITKTKPLLDKVTQQLVKKGIAEIAKNGGSIAFKYGKKLPWYRGLGIWAARANIFVSLASIVTSDTRISEERLNAQRLMELEALKERGLLDRFEFIELYDLLAKVRGIYKTFGNVKYAGEKYPGRHGEMVEDRIVDTDDDLLNVAIGYVEIYEMVLTKESEDGSVWYEGADEDGHKWKLEYSAEGHPQMGEQPHIKILKWDSEKGKKDGGYRVQWKYKVKEKDYGNGQKKKKD